ncbi:Egl nine 1 [Blomia tropicalis]|nr:Egl nine 1 [Blomia tropicalis]
MPCEVCGLTTNLMSCGRCLNVNYCTREHQIIHWKEHKKTCKQSSQHKQPTAQSRNFEMAVPSSDGTFDYKNDQVLLVSSSSNGSNGNHGTTTNHISMRSIQEDVLVNSYNTTSGKSSQFSNSLDSGVLNSQENVGLNENRPIVVGSGGGGGGGSDFNTQICPSMASLNVCDTSKSNIRTTSAPTPESSFNTCMIPSKFAPNRDTFVKNLENYCQIILNDMNQYGFCVIDNFLQNGDAILNEVLHLYQRGWFQAGQVVNNKANSNSKLIRGDQIIWVDGSEPICTNIGFLIQILDSIVQRCNTMFAVGEFLKYTITRRTKAMIACYPGNYTKYVRHIDNPNSDGRCITSIYYLNKDYDREKHGGVLRLFPQMNDGIVADIEPKFNRVIFFWSDRRNPHEVMPSARMRFAITVWYFDTSERAKAIQKYKENSIQYPNDKDLAPF